MSFQPKPTYVVNIKGVINEEELKVLKKDINEELGDQYRVIFDVEVHKLALKQRYLQ
jgi:nitrogen regulatory protein PII-like uncharacterized protein